MSVENVITENLDIWTSAIKTKSASGRGSSNKLELYGIKKLRELIFELAIRGKLVSPEVTDIPVNDLLRTIEDEKAQLVKSKEIKKPKKLPAIQNDEVPFDVPEGWQWVRLGVLGNIFNGNSVNVKLKEEKYTGLAQGLPFIATKDIGYGFEQLDYDNGVLIPSGEPKFKVAKAGAVLVCAEGGSAGKKCGITNKDICFGNKLFANQLYGNISPRYILSCYLSPTFYKMFSESMTGIIGGISAVKFSELMIPLPPLSYQNRLVSKINELMLLCDQLESEAESSIEAHKTLVETLLATLTNAKDADELNESWQRVSEHFETLFTTEDSIDQLKQTILQLAVMGKLVKQDPNDKPVSVLLDRIVKEKAQLIKDKQIRKQKALLPISEDERPFELPQGWSYARVSEVISPQREISYGIIKLEKEPEKGGIPTLRCSDVKSRNIDLSGVRNVTETVEEPYKRTRLQGGEVLVNIRGTLGGVALVSENLIGYNIAREVAMLPIHKDIIGMHLVNIIASPYFWEMIESNLKGIAYKGLNLNSLRDFVIPLPPAEEQERITRKVEHLFMICEKLKSKLANDQTTKKQLADSISSSLVS